MKFLFNTCKKAAMFGLDARIALAIFGALSVITGAALYSAIKQAKVVATVTEMNEIGKAYEQYMLDTGTDLPKKSSGYTHFDIAYLVQDNTPAIVGWKGPYLSNPIYVEDTRMDGLVHSDYKIIRLIESTEEVWGEAVTQKQCSENCLVFTRFQDVPVDIANAVDEYIDGSVDHSNGKVRIMPYAGAGKPVHLYLQVSQTLK